MKGGKTKSDLKQTDNKLKSKGAGVGKRAKKAAKDPNKPKRPPSAFFVFMEGFRKQYKEENPDNKSVAAVGKAGGAKWKSMTDAEKAPYVQKAEKRKTEYTKNIQAYNLKLAGGGGNDDESDKSKSEVNDDEEVGSGEDEDED
ncbi:NUCLEOSOME/CHROMATIN ASSEMBLY FACTOR D4, high mobility group B4 [Hibiscus trionum]|uniref:NUCLEOSOME/CHROMATIN ASSEMBLY FACTOR D4, high mobility group B4 n=1 Tax=Hibiscus trionum TaxID=183268 RepID=A0A9W7LM26_HIBTR|nr:NUCLEOSOME/CHROMATIN ASSEMBLY FACTOR D4, high mobility group B4 [Hibiscus trionum]